MDWENRKGRKAEWRMVIGEVLAWAIARWLRRLSLGKGDGRWKSGTWED